MAESKEIIKNKGWRSLGTETGRKIFTLYFIDWKTQNYIVTELIKLHKKNHKNKNPHDNQPIINIVSNYTNAWKELGYVIIKRKSNKNSKDKFHPTSNYYYATIKPYYDYLLFIGIKLSKRLKTSIEIALDNLDIREDLIRPSEDFFEVMDSLLKEILFKELNSYFELITINNKMYRKRFEIPLCIKIISKLYDANSLFLLIEYLNNKYNSQYFSIKKRINKTIVNNHIKIIQELEKAYNLKTKSFLIQDNDSEELN